MKICFDQQDEYFQFANRILRSDFEPNKSVCITTLSNSGEILGTVIFDRFTTSALELNVASVSPRFLTKNLILIVFDYAFNYCDRIRITTIVSEKNVKSLKLQRWLGFFEEARLKNFYAVDEDAILFRMLREECPWIQK